MKYLIVQLIQNGGFTSQLFGNVKQAKSVITYAASCGSTTYEMLPDDVKNIIKNCINRVTMLSVRDENSFEFIKRLSGISANIHLDPVVVGDFSNEIESIDNPEKLPTKYCVIYSYANRFDNGSEIAVIKSFCESHGMEIISLGGSANVGY